MSHTIKPNFKRWLIAATALTFVAGAATTVHATPQGDRVDTKVRVTTKVSADNHRHRHVDRTSPHRREYRRDRRERRDAREDRRDRREAREDRRERREAREDRRDRREYRRESRRDHRDYRDHRRDWRRDRWERRNHYRPYRRWERNHHGYSRRHYTPYRSSVGISFHFGDTGYSRYRWAPSRYSFYRPAYGSYNYYQNQTTCRRINVEGWHHGHREIVSVKQCSNPWDGTYIVQGSERVIGCRW